MADDIAAEHHAREQSSQMHTREGLRLQPSREIAFLPENGTADRFLQQWLDARYIAASESAWCIFRDSGLYDIPASSTDVPITANTQTTISPNDGKKRYPKFIISETSTNITDEYPIYRRSTFSNSNARIRTKARKTMKIFF